MTSSFFEQVYRVVRLVPRGQVATYGQIAKILGMPHAARTVGWALRGMTEETGAPWHRVVNARGTLSFEEGSQGALEQRSLLEEEGVMFTDQGRIELSVYGWAGLDLAERDQILKLSPQN